MISVHGYAAAMANMLNRLRILAFEPFDACSHRAVRESITRHSRHEWTWRTRPGRAWKWRMRLGAIELIQQAERAGDLDRPIDVIFATSLMSMADLIATLPKALRSTPTVLYMHENQMAYPPGVQKAGWDQRDVHFALTNLTSAISADLTIFNSRWNRESFLDGVERLLRIAPDTSLSDLTSELRERSIVIWPPVEAPPESVTGGLQSSSSGGEITAGVLHNPVRVVWPHRWEHDKGPEELLAIARRYSRQLNLRWTILGEQYRDAPPAFAVFRREFADRIDHIGFEPDRRTYWRRLDGCDWVLSTARHEFFGIAVVEAMLAGCLPWLPASLSYPELLPENAIGLSPLSPPADPQAAQDAIRAHLQPALASRAVSLIDDAIASLAGVH